MEKRKGTTNKNKTEPTGSRNIENLREERLKKRKYGIPKIIGRMREKDECTRKKKQKNRIALGRAQVWGVYYQLFRDFLVISCCCSYDGK